MNSIWYEGVSLPVFPHLEGDTSTEVLIIGGGIAGILLAYRLQSAGISYLLLERGRICGGTTGRTTAKITVHPGIVYADLIERAGLEAARLYYGADLAALREYASLCRLIDCDYTTADNYLYSTRDRALLERELSALLRLGCRATLKEALPLPFPTVGGICVEGQAHFHPLKFIAAIARGLNIREETHVTHLERGIAHTAHGNVRARKTVVTTHFPFLGLRGGYPLKMYQHRSYVLALRGADAPTDMYADENKRGFSFRRAGDLLLLGGGGHRTGKKGGGYAALRELAARHYPDAEGICHWAAEDCISLDGLPYIGQYARSTPSVYTATGFNKWGMAGAMLASRLLFAAVTGEAEAAAHPLSPRRSMLTARLLSHIGETALNLLRPSAPRCPHLGCALRWNAAEHSWDCPCHGSRFSEAGELLDGPANRNLPR